MTLAQYQAALILRVDDLPSIADARERFEAVLLAEPTTKDMDPAQLALRKALGVA